MIEVKNLVKKYGDHTAVNNISFTVEKGKIYGLLGPNGAGKSTTMNIVTGCLAASEGSVTVDGHDIFEDPKAAKKCIGYLPENPPLYGDMTPLEYLTFVAEAKKVKSGYLGSQVREVMEITGLTDMKDRLIRNLSKGYRQRVGIAQAMLGEPDVIILDEPTVGLDPKQILEIRELIRKLGETKTVILSSHILAEISAVCERVMIISHGNLVANDTIEHLEEIANRSNKLRITVRGDSEAVKARLETIEGVLSVDIDEVAEDHASFDIDLIKDRDLRDDIFFAMANMKCAILSMQFEQTTLEDIFLALTDENVRPDEDGNLPSVEEVLEARGKKDDTLFSHMSDEELEALANEKEDDQTEEDEAEPDVDVTEENTEKSEDEGYKPLFGGN
ncbi:MAG: ATP-binding cassette domain-containing protein [Clostridia bacterium]|nr:ATP-binding cassette domain-containing protein [Clostridia bacterium]